jgi:hypothetical protein
VCLESNAQDKKTLKWYTQRDGMKRNILETAILCLAAFEGKQLRSAV